MEIKELINHPELLDRDTLYELRSLIALYPYYQTARLLMLQNLYLLHDPTFDEELRRAAIYITDRRVLFQMIEAAHYKLRTNSQNNQRIQTTPNAQTNPSRTLTLIDNFLESIPKEEDSPEEKKQKRKPTPADAAVDYVAYLLETEGGDVEEGAFEGFSVQADAADIGVAGTVAGGFNTKVPTSREGDVGLPEQRRSCRVLPAGRADGIETKGGEDIPG